MTEAEQPVRITGICGSIRQGSYTRMTVEIALQGAAELGAQTHLIDLREYELVFCAGKDEDVAYPEDVFRLRREVKAAQGMIWGTPEYHGGISGVFKNALDLMGFDEFEGKLIGLVGVSGGAMGALNALNSLRTIGRSLHAWVIPEQTSVPRAWSAFDANGKINDSDLEERIKRVGRQVARFTYLHTSDKAREFLRLWEGAMPNPGGV